MQERVKRLETQNKQLREYKSEVDALRDELRKAQSRVVELERENAELRALLTTNMELVAQ